MTISLNIWFQRILKEWSLTRSTRARLPSMNSTQHICYIESNWHKFAVTWPSTILWTSINVLVETKEYVWCEYDTSAPSILWLRHLRGVHVKLDLAVWMTHAADPLDNLHDLRRNRDRWHCKVYPFKGGYRVALDSNNSTNSTCSAEPVKKAIPISSSESKVMSSNLWFSGRRQGQPDVVQDGNWKISKKC